MKDNVAILLIIICLLAISAHGDIDIPMTSGGSSGGGHSSPNLNNFIRQVESWQAKNPERFDYLKKLLNKQSLNDSKYVPPGVWLYYPSKNKTISRYDPIEIGALVVNTNPIEARRPLYLSLEIQEPGENSFKPAKVATQIIQVNDYSDRFKTSLRIFPEFSSFEYLKQVGVVRLRVSVTDGQYKYNSSIQTNDPGKGYYGDISLNVYNIPPVINNTTMSVNPNIAKWDDYFQYTAYIEDKNKYENTSIIAGKEENPVQVTLHIYNSGVEVFNTTKLILPTDTISFSTREANIFSDKDAGKNFTYRYSCFDGINITQTSIGVGPNLRPNPKIKVNEFSVLPEDSNYYWWQKYRFSFKAKSENPEGIELTANLFVDTDAHPNKYIASRTIYLNADNFTDIVFGDMKPFDVADCNQTVRYYFTYSAPDQDGRAQSQYFEGENINSKLIKYEIYSPLMVTNLLLIMGSAILGGIMIERKFYRKEGR